MKAQLLALTLFAAPAAAATCDNPPPDFWADADKYNVQVMRDIARETKKAGIPDSSTIQAAKSTMAFCHIKVSKEFEGGNGGQSSIIACQSRMLCSIYREFQQ